MDLHSYSINVAEKFFFENNSVLDFVLDIYIATTSVSIFKFHFVSSTAVLTIVVVVVI